MSREFRKLLLCGAPLVVVLCITSVVLITRAASDAPSPTRTASLPPRVKDGPRNLFLQPEALRVSRRLGKRFGPSARGTSVIVGTVSIGGNEHHLTVSRRQTEYGEDIKLELPGKLLTWTAAEGIQAVPSTPSETERLLGERLVYDSPDYFVLAQLHGASYSTVAQNLRPENAADNYSGPLWTVVRVEQSPNGVGSETKKWRLYYINSQTGLIDRVVSQFGPKTVEAEVISWNQQNGEMSPARIDWSIDSQLIMSYQVSSVSHSE